MDDALDEPMAPGRRAGPYEVLRVLGEGGMGRVYEARDRRDGARVALKTLHPALADSPRALARFRREASLLERARHPHVVRVLAHGASDGLAYIAMERLDGERLTDHLTRRPPTADCVDILLPIVHAVATLHELGVVHRDLKPDNILLAREGAAWRPTLVDFGVSRPAARDERATLTDTGEVLGTPAYMSPEQVQGRRVTAATDVYSLGVVLYECITHTRPFLQTERLDLYLAVARGDFARPRAVDPSLPEALEALVLRAMALDASARFDSAWSLGAALAQHGSPDAAARWLPRFVRREPLAPREPAAAPRPTRRWPVVALAASLAAVALLVVAWRPAPAPSSPPRRAPGVVSRATARTPSGAAPIEAPLREDTRRSTTSPPAPRVMSGRRRPSVASRG